MEGSDRPGLLSRWLHGDPPATEPVDRFARYGFFLAWLLGLVGIIGGVIGSSPPPVFSSRRSA
jgi:hypothetical protein